VGSTIEEATILTIMLDNACHIQLLCEAAGGVGEEFPADDVDRLHDTITRVGAVRGQLRVPAPQGQQP
jgi:L-fuculose-phosphate aldolase